MTTWRERARQSFPGERFLQYSDDFTEAIFDLSSVWLRAIDSHDSDLVARVVDFYEWLGTADPRPCEHLYECLETLFFELDRPRRDALYGMITDAQFELLKGQIWYCRVNDEPSDFNVDAEYLLSRGRRGTTRS